MQDPKFGFTILKQRYQALITTMIPHKMWEISLPVLERTTYAQTGLILRRGVKFDTLTDNGTTNNGMAFSDTGNIRRILHHLMIEDNVAISRNEYYTCNFISGSSKQLVQHVNEMVDFLTSLDSLMKRHV